MQLITAGMGFIGMNTARALVELGESCVLTTRNPARARPDFVLENLGKRVFVEAVDITDRSELLEVANRHRITGIIHLAGAVLGRGSSLDTLEEIRITVQGMLNVLLVAQERAVSRVGIASTIGVYAGVAENPFREDMPLPMGATHPLPMSKKVLELIGSLGAWQTALQIIDLRIGGAWGPLFHHPPSPWNVSGHMVRSAVNKEAFDASRVFAEEGVDSCYVKDTARAIALLQLAPRLNHPTYNVGSGRTMKNKELAAAIRKVIPDADIQLLDGFDPRGLGRNLTMDTTRLLEDAGFTPAYDVDRGVADYVAWLRKGNTY